MLGAPAAHYCGGAMRSAARDRGVAATAPYAAAGAASGTLRDRLSLGCGSLLLQLLLGLEPDLFIAALRTLVLAPQLLGTAGDSIMGGLRKVVGTGINGRLGFHRPCILLGAGAPRHPGDP